MFDHGIAIAKFIEQVLYFLGGGGKGGHDAIIPITVANCALLLYGMRNL
jgi:hypothetical protein